MTPGQAAYEATTGISTGILWSDLKAAGQDPWERIAQAAINVARESLEVKEVLPKLFVDGKLAVLTQETPANADVTVLRLELAIPAVDRVRGSQGPMLSKLLKEASTPGAVVRLAITNDVEVKAQFARLDKDGTVRQFQEGEGTW